jgi:alpha-tubulin suppressor-like RCC1 family protein
MSSTGAVMGECVPGEAQCAGGGLEVCDDTGHWLEPSPCLIACSAGACVTVAEMSLGSAHTCARLTDGAARCWGSSQYGQLGDGSVGDGAMSPKPSAVLEIQGATQIELGNEHSCARLSDGTARCWGHNGFFKIGDGTLENRPVPVAVPGAMDAAGVALGGSHTCAWLADATARCWGNNQYGQIGDGTKSEAAQPAAVLNLNTVLSMSSAVRHTCALGSGADLWCWGENYSGELGIGTSGPMTEKTTPVAVPLTDVAQVSLGHYSSYALLHNGSIWAWGANTYGQLGDGSNVDKSKPTPVVGIIQGTMISGGGLHACALVTDSGVVCWGSNSDGQLGNGSAGGNEVTPVQVPGTQEAIGVAAGERHTCAWLSDGTALCWGKNDFGQLGDGTAGGSKAVPVKVAW